MYKDKDKQRATTKARVRRYRERKTQQGVTGLDLKALRSDTQGVTESVTLAELDADGNPIPEY